MPEKADAVIIGGGVMGCAIAYNLAKEGLKPVVIEKSDIGGEASGSNGGGVRQSARNLKEMPLAMESIKIYGQLHEELDMDVEEVAYAQQIAGRHISVDAPFANGDDNKNSLLDVMPNDAQPAPDNTLMDLSLKTEIENALSTLTEREAQVIRLSFGLNQEHAHTLEEIGEKFNLTRERVRQIESKAIRKMRHPSRSRSLLDYTI